MKFAILSTPTATCFDALPEGPVDAKIARLPRACDELRQDRRLPSHPRCSQRAPTPSRCASATAGRRSRWAVHRTKELLALT